MPIIGIFSELNVINTNDSFKLVKEMVGNFTLPLSVWTKESEAHIFLCEDYKPPESKCYWIILRNTEKNNEIRKCEKNTIPRKGGENSSSGKICSESVNNAKPVRNTFI